MRALNYCIRFTLVLTMMVITSSCKKIHEFDYVEDFEGNFNFTTIETLQNTHPDNPYEVTDTITYYGTIHELRRDEIEITYSGSLPSTTSCYDREYYYLHMINALVDKSGKLTLPCVEGGEIQQFSGQFIGIDTLHIVIETRLSEFSSLEHKITGVR